MLNILSPMFIKESNKMVFMDFSDNKVYECKVVENRLELFEVENELEKDCFTDVRNQQNAMKAEIPYDKIREVINVEQELADKNSDIRRSI
jgi:diadenosine tetraphosphate (Ap4A) HIT family hydrolase